MSPRSTASLYASKFLNPPYSLYKLNLLSVSCNICFIASIISLLSAIVFLCINGLFMNFFYSVLLGFPFLILFSFFLYFFKFDIYLYYIYLFIYFLAFYYTI